MCFGVGKSYTTRAVAFIDTFNAQAHSSHHVIVCSCLHATSPLVFTHTITAIFSETNTASWRFFLQFFFAKTKIDNCLLLDEASPNYALKWNFTWISTLSFQNVDHKFKYHSKKGQLPFIELNGQQIGDSTTIIKELSQKFDKDIDAGLTKEQKNISHAMISMVENHLTFVILSWRAKNPKEMINGYKINFQQSLGSKIPNAILSFVFRFNYGHRVSCHQSSGKLFNEDLKFKLKF